MSRTLHRLLIAALLALAVPLQGMAAASAGLCMAMGQHHHGDVVHAQVDASTAAHEHSGGVAQETKKQDPAHCPPCVSCCAAAAISPAILPALPQQPASAAIAAPAHSTSGGLPDELDRPPLAV